MDHTLHLASTESTNEDAYALAVKGAEHGFSVLADVQHGGKGRLGREWLSLPGTGLYCSIILRPALPFSDFPRLTLTAGLSLCTVIEKLEGCSTFGLKWPNDLYCNGRKCGGILVESSTPALDDNVSFVVVGIGLNVNNRIDDFPPEMQENVTSLFTHTGDFIDISGLFSKIHRSLLEHLQIHEEYGFQAILKEWRKRDVLYGKEMQWLTQGKKVVTGVGLGPDDTGQLLVRSRDGKLHKILSGDVTGVRDIGLFNGY